MNTLLIPAATVAPAFDAISAAYAAFEAGDIAKAVRLLAWSPTAATGDGTGTGDADGTSDGIDTPTVALPRPAATLPSASSTSTPDDDQVPDVCCRCSLALEKRARRRARAARFRELGIDVVTHDRALCDAAYVAVMDAGVGAKDAAIVHAWIAAIGNAGIPRHAPWAGLPGHMKDALARVGGDTGRAGRAMALHECASNLWSRPADAAFEAGQVAA